MPWNAANTNQLSVSLFQTIRYESVTNFWYIEKNKIFYDISYHAVPVNGTAERLKLFINSSNTDSVEILKHITKIGSYYFDLTKYGLRFDMI
ncbi:hypothetical protein X798_00650 [Onchocerca flexuosa]|uniref:Uncharacterized protein n=1 Tax=Onchocerca flexuosa TaxID=387005 RepID=A0A238C3T8_9BILA|nr:hypothetical protein X798_00650 [Onchocerca flexuosa]